MPLKIRRLSAFTRNHAVVLLLLLNSFSWYFFGQLIVSRVGDAVGTAAYGSVLEVAYPLSVILSALVGSVWFSRVRKKDFLSAWLLFGVLASLLPAVPIINPFVGVSVIIILGTSLGVGMPFLLGYFTESTPVESRGFVGGLTFFMVTASAPLVIIASSMLSLVSNVVFFAAWRFWSLPLMLLLPSEMGEDQPPSSYKRGISFLNVFHNRAFCLYFLAWLMFSMVDGFEELVISNHGEFGSAMRIVEPVIAGLSALLAGILADRAGRKRVIIFGFASLGLAYAILGIASQVAFSWFFYFVADGFAMGILLTMFTVVVWGELAFHGSEKYYAVGEAPWFLTQVLYVLSAPYVGMVSEASAFSLAAFFLFIAVVPLLYAPETLSQRKIEERQLKVYAENAVKLRQKVEQKRTA